MSKLIIISGLPASGKSTKAKEIMAESENTVRVNKDLLRSMLHFDKYSQLNEEWVRDASRKLTSFFLSNGVNVISDDTNLNPDTIQNLEDIARLHNAKVEHIKMNTSMLQCIIQDQQRGERGLPSVGELVIKKMAMQYLTYMQAEKVIVCDFDATVANGSNYSDVIAPNVKIIKSIDEYRKSNNVKVIFITKRPENERSRITAWLTQFVSFPYELLLMADNGDERADTFIKAEMYDKYLKRMNVVCVFDSIDSSWRTRLLPVVDLSY